MDAKTKNKESFQSEVDHILSQLSTLDPESEAYSAAVKNLSVLCESRSKARLVSPEAILAVAANIAGILLILYFEKTGVVTSKAMSFIFRK